MVRHVVTKHAGMDDDSDVVLFLRPHNVIVRRFDSLKRKKHRHQYFNTVFICFGPHLLSSSRPFLKPHTLYAFLICYPHENDQNALETEEDSFGS